MQEVANRLAAYKGTKQIMDDNRRGITLQGSHDNTANHPEQDVDVRLAFCRTTVKDLTLARRGSHRHDRRSRSRSREYKDDDDAFQDLLPKVAEHVDRDAYEAWRCLLFGCAAM